MMNILIQWGRGFAGSVVAVVPVSLADDAGSGNRWKSSKKRNEARQGRREKEKSKERDSGEVKIKRW